MDVIVDDLDIPNERLAWLQVRDDIKKPVYLRTETEVSRMLTLISRLTYVQGLSFQERFALTKVAQFHVATAGEVLVTARGNVSLLRSDDDDADDAASGDDATVKSASPVEGLGVVSLGRQQRAQRRQVGDGASTSAPGQTNALSLQKPTHMYIIVFGSVGLRVETINGRVQSVLTKGDAVGNPLMEEALPPGSQFVALEPVELLKFSMDEFREYLAAVDAAELQSRIHFFRSQLLVPILQPMSNSELEEFSRSCWTLRLHSKELITKEGSPADAMYFLQSGKLKVVREVDFSTLSSGNAGGPAFLGGTITSNSSGGGGISAHSGMMGSSYTPMVKLLELATLQEGEYFGELALIRHRVDGGGNRRTAATMQKLLASTSSGISTTLPGNNAGGTTAAALQLLHDVTEMTTPKARGGNQGRRSLPMGPSQSVLPNPGVLRQNTTEEFVTSSSVTDDENDSAGDDDAKEISFRKQPLMRQATVYAHTPAVVLVLPRRCFIKFFRGAVLIRLREYAKGYPSQQDIRAHFQRQQKWDTFKSELVAEVRGVGSHKRAAGSSKVSSNGMHMGRSSGGTSPREPSQSPRRK